MRIAYDHTARNAGRGGKYPWAQLRSVGDYFEVPPEAAKGVRNSAWRMKHLSGYVFVTRTIEGGGVRVMLLDIEPGAMAA